MKKFTLPSFALLLVAVQSSYTAIPDPQPVTFEVDRSPHSRTWQTVRLIETEEGATLVTNRFEELQTGLHRWTEQGWVEADPRIELFRDGALVRNLQYQAIFSPNLASAGSIDILLPDQNRLIGQIYGLAYFDGDRSVLIAQPQDCAGEVGGAEQNEVIYRNAFTDFEIDVRYVVKRASFAQELILKERLPSPLVYGLSENAVLTLLTEFTGFPQIQKYTRLFEEAQPGRPAITDERITLGSMEFASGKAFTIGEERSFAVSKSFEQFEKRWFLLEKVPWQGIRPELEKLPARQARNQPLKKAKIMQAKNGITLPPARRAKKPTKPMQMAQVSIRPQRGFTFDFDLITTTNDYRFQRDKTYYVSGEVVLSGSNVFEGGCVIKFAPTNSARLNITGSVFCDSSPYAPIILTARDDHTVGETIGSASLSGYYALTALNIGVNASDLKHLRISYAQQAVAYANAASGPHYLTHAQIVHCQKGVVPDKTVYYLRNVLMYDVLTNFYAGASSSSTGRCEHLTIDLASTFNYTNNSTNALLLTNSLVVAITNPGAGYQTNSSSNVGADSTSANVFQTAGGSSHYLLNDTYRNLGTTNITTSLLADLKSMTTYPPQLLTNTVSANTTLSPQAQRDTDTPDYGYHLVPLDWVASGTTIQTNATLLLTGGVALGTYGASTSYGALIQMGGQLVSEGTPTVLNRIVRYNTVQEQATTNWSSSTIAPGILVNTGGLPPPKATFRFTDWSLLGGSGEHFRAALNGLLISNVFTFQHCTFGGGVFYSKRTATAITNCFYDRVAMTLDDVSVLVLRYFYNNLLRGGAVDFEVNNEINWFVYDNLFDKTALTQYGNVPGNNNAYVTNYGRFTPNGANDVILTNSPLYLTSTLGKYYYPTNDGMLSLLINAGSRNATNAGLYHFTTITSQVKETNSTVDIGFHYVAVDGNGNPVDTDIDGVPDYQEDANGNGLVDSGETDWQNASDFGLRVRITYPRP